MTKDKFLKNYKKLKPLYSKFATQIKNILKARLKEKDYKYQKLAPRAKSIKSLSDNFDLAGRYNKLDQIYDLAGCRVIFYLEEDKESFSREIYDMFEFVDEKLKHSEDSYNAKHIIVKLKTPAKRTKGFSRYKNLKCEIQLTTVLDHAWSEIEHDIIYKPPKELKEQFQKTFAQIQNSFFDVMKNHIKPANNTFGFIFEKHRSAITAHKTFSRPFLNRLQISKSNNNIFDQLESLKKATGEFKKEITHPKQIGKIINSILNKSPSLKIKPRNYSFGSRPGITYEQVALLCIEIINHLIWLEPIYFLEILLKLSRDQNKNISDKALTSIKDFSQYDGDIYNQIGYGLQQMLINEIHNWGEIKLKKNVFAVLEIIKSLLNSSFEGVSSDSYNSVGFQIGSLVPTADLKKIQGSTIKLVDKLFALTKNIETKLTLLDSLHNSTRFPQMGASPQLKTQLLLNAKNVLAFYIRTLPKAEYPLIMKMENHGHRIARAFRPIDIPRINNFKNLIKKNKNFELYKLLVGFDFRPFNFFGKYEKGDHQKVEAYRERKILSLTRKLTKRNLPYWSKKLSDVIKFYSIATDGGSYNYFRHFLRILAKQKPILALRLLSMNETSYSPFLLEFLLGIKESQNNELFEKTYFEWLMSDSKLIYCAQMFEWSGHIDFHFLEKIFQEAQNRRDLKALAALTVGITRHYDGSADLKDLFIKCIKELTKHKNQNWVLTHGKSEIGPLLKTLSREECDLVLKNIKHIPKINYFSETILLPLSEKYPEEIVDFFSDRINIQIRTRNLFKYDAIPSHLDKIIAPLKAHKRVVIPIILKWFHKRSHSHRREAANLIKALFPSFDPILERSLIFLIKTKKPGNIDTVFSILKVYEGSIFTHKVCKEIIKQFPRKVEYRKELIYSLKNFGFVTGKYGLTDGLKRKISEVQGWKKSGTKEIRAFANEYISQLKKEIPYKIKDADERHDQLRNEHNWRNE